MHRFHRAVIATLLLAIFCMAVSAAARPDDAKWTVVEEEWFLMELAGANAGYSSQIVLTDGTNLRTDGEVSMKFGRGNLVVKINLKSSFVETTDGKPVSMQLVSDMSQQIVESSWVFRADHVEHTVRQGGNETTKQLPLPEGEWLTPRALERHANDKRKEGAKEFTVRTLDPNNGLAPMTVATKRIGEGQHDHEGVMVDVTIWSSENDMMPGVISTERIDAAGNLLFQEVPMPGLGNMITRRTTKQKATGAADGPAPEILVKTFITPDKPIPNPEKAVKSRLRLTLMDGTINPLPSIGAQRVEMSEDGKSAILKIDINDPQSASAADEANPEFLAASAMIDTNDELIQKLAKRAVASVKGDADGAVDPMQRAEALRQFVRTHISKKGMATAFASASETAKMKTGDCSEHGVLLCALLRADGIPARVATGLVYVDEFEGNAGIFGWHMWTQALIDGKWVDLDASMRERFNATHVLTSASSLDDGAFAGDMAAIVQMIGNLKIEVLDVQYE